ncbi:MAG TPA: CxxH/CxxC protein [Sedimentibacter sp.]|nr:CxxH/CxxC protein [Sedimentibacter sp.]HQB63857.1 CxxH/CxxC protein [Sedimentibacter sp.]
MKEKYEEIFACKDHADQALDDYVNKNEAAPELIKASEEKKCSYCQKNAEYIIK